MYNVQCSTMDHLIPCNNMYHVVPFRSWYHEPSNTIYHVCSMYHLVTFVTIRSLYYLVTCNVATFTNFWLLYIYLYIPPERFVEGSSPLKIIEEMGFKSLNISSICLLYIFFKEKCSILSGQA